jgi:hypothetical protein
MTGSPEATVLSLSWQPPEKIERRIRKSQKVPNGALAKGRTSAVRHGSVGNVMYLRR